MRQQRFEEILDELIEQEGKEHRDDRCLCSDERERSGVERLASRVPGWVWASFALTALHLLALLIAATPRVVPTTMSSGAPTSPAVLLLTPLTRVPTLTPSSEPLPTLGITLAPTPSDTPMLDQVLASGKTLTPPPVNTPTPTLAASNTPTPSPSPTPTFPPLPTTAHTATPIHTPFPSATHTAAADPNLRLFVPPAYEGTTLAEAVAEYNTMHPYEITMHVVSRDSGGMDGEMYRDLLDRGWRIMGPEDFVGSVNKPGWPYIIIAREDALDANSVRGWKYVLDHEFVHMIAAANLALEGLNLAELMRRPDGTFTHEALFHEVCADFYPRDEDGNHQPVARFYDAMDRMSELLRVFSEYDSGALAYRPPPQYEVLEITGVSLIDAACVWDRNAIEAVKGLYDNKRGPGAFNLLFPSY